MEHLFPQLLTFFDDFAAEVTKLDLERADCGECGRCCQSPPFLMTTSDLEYQLVMSYIREHALPFSLQFIPCSPDHGDKREGYLSWTCPLYTSKGGCAVYPVRPFACRIFGPLAQEPITFPYCVFKNPRIYHIPPEIPLWDRYAAILRQYDFKRGYLFPRQVCYDSPILELILGMSLPWSRMVKYPL